MLSLKSLKENSEKIRKNDFYSRVYRTNWKFLEKRVLFVFNKLKEGGGDHFGSLGNLYFNANIALHNKTFDSMPTYKRLNSIHIHTGHRFLNVGHVNEEQFKWLTENGAQLWYSQSPSGDVMVFIAPYKSEIHKLDESDIIIDYVRNPSHLSLCRIDKHFSIFFKYCASTSINSSGSFSAYFYRRYLLYKDFRYKSEIQSNIVNLLLKIVPLLSLVVAVTAVLVASKKITF